MDPEKNPQPEPQSVESLETSSNAFCSLPSKIILQIVKYVQAFVPLEAEKVKVQKLWCLVKLLAGTPFEHVVYPPKSILNSFQSLAAVNWQLYHLCRPLLWQNLKFPTSVPIHMFRFTESVLPRQGHLIESISIGLSGEWFKTTPGILEKENQKEASVSQDGSSANAATPEPSSLFGLPITKPHVFFDNTISSPMTSEIFFRDGPRGISPDTVVQILTKCPNLHTLKLCFPICTQGSTKKFAGAVQSRLIVLMPHLCKLRHFDICCRPSVPVCDRRMAQILEMLPLLESLSCRFLRRSRGGNGVRLFSKRLSALKHLKRLRLDSVDSLDSTWACSWPDPPVLTHLEIVDCRNFSTLAAPRFLKPFAHSLTHLHLECGNLLPGRRRNRAQQPSLFELPMLTDLIIHQFIDEPLFRAFRNCEKLRRFTYLYFSPDHWHPFAAEVYSRIWPQLRFLHVQHDIYDDEPVPPEVIRTQTVLREYCERSGVELYLGGETPSNPSWFPFQ